LSRTDSESGSHRFFNEVHEWGRAYEELPPGEQSRIDALVALVSSDTRSILDVGCGDGVVTNILADRGFEVIGLDFAPAALIHVRTKVVEGSADRLPFGDRSFDCVMAANVFEHLTAGVFEQAIGEVMRVARRSIVLSFPHREDLVLAQTRCTRCSATFHAARHVRSIDVENVVDWFEQFVVTQFRLAGEPWRYRSRRLQRFAQLLGNVWYRTDGVCPNCGYPTEPPVPNQLVRTANGMVQQLLGRLRGSRSSQLVIALERRSARNPA